MQFWKKTILFWLALVLVILPFITACSGQSAAQPQPRQPIPVVRGDLISKVTGSGKISVPNDAKLAFGSGGKLNKLPVKEGDRVTKGTLIAQLDTANLEVALAQAQVAMDQAKLARTAAQSAVTAAQSALDRTKGYADMRDVMTELQWEIKIAEMNMLQAQNDNNPGGAGYWRQVITNNQSTLAKKTQDLATLLTKPEYAGTITYDIMGDKYDRLTADDMHSKQQALDTAQLTLDKTADGIIQAQKNLDLLQKQLNDATINAPFDGIVATVYVKEGDIIPAPTVSPQVILYFVDTSKMQVTVSLDEMDVPGVQKNQDAVISVDALPNLKLNGKVSSLSVGPVSMNGVGGGAIYEAKVDFNQPACMQIKPGMAASVEIITGEKKNVLILPASAIKQNGQGQSYVTTADNPQTPVKVGMASGGLTEILSGLKDGEKVFTDKIDGRWSLPAGN